MAGEPKLRPSSRLLPVAAATVSLAVLVTFAGWAAVLLAYPFDWSPDEGMTLDWARRLLEDPASLYPSPPTVVPFPNAYTPLLSVLLAPIVALSETPLLPARMLMILCVVVSAAAIFNLADGRRHASLGLAAVALGLAAFNWSVYLLLVRIDGLMVALLLAASVMLMPQRLTPGGDRLDRRRLLAGTALILLAVLAKPTAVLIGSPLVVVWLVVDRKAGLRLMAAVGGGGLLVLAALQLVSSGGFLPVMGLWATHGTVPAQVLRITRYFAVQHLLQLAVLGVMVVVAMRARTRPWHDGSWVLIAGGMTVVVLLGKPGAYWSYFLPLSLSIPVAIARIGGRLAPRLTSIVLALAAVLLAATRPFPAPTEVDRRSAAALYEFIDESSTGAPLLAFRPEYAYFVAGVPVEAEASSFYLLSAAGAPGAELVAKRTRERVYELVIGDPRWISLVPAVDAAIVAGYRPAACCYLRFFHIPEPLPIYAFVPADSTLRFRAPPGARCVSNPPFPERMLTARGAWLHGINNARGDKSDNQ